MPIHPGQSELREPQTTEPGYRDEDTWSCLDKRRVSLKGSCGPCTCWVVAWATAGGSSWCWGRIWGQMALSLVQCGGVG